MSLSVLLPCEQTCLNICVVEIISEIHIRVTCSRSDSRFMLNASLALPSILFKLDVTFHFNMSFLCYPE